MPLVPADSLVAQVGRLRNEAAYHKREMYRHKDELRRSKQALDALEEQCRQRGITVTDAYSQQRGAGDFHGPDRSTS